MSFLTLLSLTILISFVMLIGAFSTLYQIIKGKISKRYWILILGIVAILPYIVISDIIPKVRDINDFKSGNYESVIGTCNEVSLSGFSREIRLEHEFYEFSPSEFEPQCKKKYKIYYLPHSHYIVKWEELD